MKQTGYIAPEFKKTAFNCPFCGAYAQQNWNTAYSCDNNDILNFYPNSMLFVSNCIACGYSTLWDSKKKIMIYPTQSGPSPSEDMPPKAKELYEEARQIATASPRAAVALLRCSLEELTEALGEEKGSLNTRIGNLVKKGLPSRVQDALDIIRVFGNEAGSHVGKIDLSDKDDQETVYKLFNIMNFIVEKMITEPKTIDELTDRIPENKTEGIKNRDN